MRELLSEKLQIKAFFKPITFNAAKNLQTWRVPSGIEQIHIDWRISSICRFSDTPECHERATRFGNSDGWWCDFGRKQ